MSVRVGIVGARGHVGTELVRLVVHHPELELALVVSRELDGQRVSTHVGVDAGALCYERLEPIEITERGIKVVVLALPNGRAGRFVEALEQRAPDTLIVDLSADYRFDAAWYYGLPELTRNRYTGQRRISNPGCYATAMQLAIAPLVAELSTAPVCFGVSGYSGAGTTPSANNDPEILRDNLVPYHLTGHLHEREVSHHLGLDVEFMPHVAPHFRGLSVTCNLHLADTFDQATLLEHYTRYYADEPLIHLRDEPPWISRIRGRQYAELGGITVAADGHRAVLVATLDNLLKGAATQALQNINLALGFDEIMGIPHE